MAKTHHYTGLTDAQVAESRRKNGANILTPPEKDPLWKRFLEKFGDPLIIILMIAGALSVGISCYEFWGLDKGADVFFEPVGILCALFPDYIRSFLNPIGKTQLFSPTINMFFTFESV